MTVRITSWMTHFSDGQIACIVSFAVFSVVSITVEYYYGTRSNIQRSLAGNITSLEYENLARAPDSGWVHLKGVSPSYSWIVDPYFGIAVRASHLISHVEYYQWHETIDRFGKEEYVSYQLKWSTYQESSLSFRQTISHWNPSQPNVEETSIVSSFFVGPLNVSVKLLSYGANYKRIFLTPQQVQEQFIGSDASSRFYYASDGYFYSKYFANEASRKAWADSMNSGSSSAEPLEAGDIRVSFECFSSDPITVVGFRNGNSIVDIPLDGRSISGYAEGDINATEFFKRQNSSIRIWSFVFRTISAIVVVVCSFQLKPVPRMVFIIGCAAAILLIRSSIWDDFFLSKRTAYSIAVGLFSVSLAAMFY